MTASFDANGNRVIRVHQSASFVDSDLSDDFAVVAAYDVQREYPRRTILGVELRQDPFQGWQERRLCIVTWYRCPCTTQDHPHQAPEGAQKSAPTIPRIGASQ